MGDLMGHVLPGTLLLAVGLWRVWASVARYSADRPPAFRVRAWNPVPATRWRLLELHVVAGGAFLEMCVELVYAIPSPLRVLITGDVGGAVDPAAHLGGLEHAGMLLMFFLYGALALASEKTGRLLRPLPDAALSLAFATAFTAELLLFHFHSTTHAGLEGYYHRLLLFLLGLCVAALVAGALLPSSFPADLGAGVLVAVQGMWFYQTGMTLYGPMLPAGCGRRFDDGSDARIECRAGGALERAEQLADFQLFALVFLVFVYVLGCYAVAAARYGNTTPEVAGADDGGPMTNMSLRQ